MAAGLGACPQVHMCPMTTICTCSLCRAWGALQPEWLSHHLTPESLDAASATCCTHCIATALTNGLLLLLTGPCSRQGCRAGWDCLSDGDLQCLSVGCDGDLQLECVSECAGSLACCAVQRVKRSCASCLTGTLFCASSTSVCMRTTSTPFLQSSSTCLSACLTNRSQTICFTGANHHYCSIAPSVKFWSLSTGDVSHLYEVTHAAQTQARVKYSGTWQGEIAIAIRRPYSGAGSGLFPRTT